MGCDIAKWLALLTDAWQVPGSILTAGSLRLWVRLFEPKPCAKDPHTFGVTPFIKLDKKYSNKKCLCPCSCLCKYRQTFFTYKLSLIFKLKLELNVE
jgi:hypothetical protein